SWDFWECKAMRGCRFGRMAAPSRSVERPRLFAAVKYREPHVLVHAISIGESGLFHPSQLLLQGGIDVHFPAFYRSLERLLGYTASLDVGVPPVHYPSISPGGVAPRLVGVHECSARLQEAMDRPEQLAFSRMGQVVDG